MKKEQPECKVDEHGNKRWWLHGKCHREGGPAVEWRDGGKAWLKDGNFHREDGPAFEGADGSREWWLHGKCHREDGPAIERPGGYKEWYLHGEQVHPEQIVDLQLSRGTFCYYNEETQTLHFDENK